MAPLTKRRVLRNLRFFLGRVGHDANLRLKTPRVKDARVRQVTHRRLLSLFTTLPGWWVIKEVWGR